MNELQKLCAYNRERKYPETWVHLHFKVSESCCFNMSFSDHGLTKNVRETVGYLYRSDPWLCRKMMDLIEDFENSGFKSYFPV